MDKSNLRILTADDHQLSLRLIQKQLGFMGFSKIETASNGAEAQRRLEQEHFDIVIMDWAMPVKDGFTLLKECRADSKFQQIAFAMLTSEAQPHMIKQALDAGAVTYIIKPVTQDAFAQKMDEILAWLEKNKKDRPVSKLLDEVLDRTGKELTGAISDSVMKTVEALFGQKLYEIEKKNVPPVPTSFAVTVTFSQGDGRARLRLVFDRPLLESLVADFYPQEDLGNDAVLRDAASEITNIVCNKIKAFVNQKGFVMEMGFPEAAAVEPQAARDDGTVSLNFSLVGNTLSIRNVLHVDMS